MNILPINYSPKIAFKSYVDDGIIGYDDSISQNKRNFIREHYESWHMPYKNIYDVEHRKSDYQLRQIADGWEKYHDIQRIDGTNIYRGQTLVDKPCTLYGLKNKGIKTVIDLVGYGPTYEQEVKNVGLNYYTYNVYDNWWAKVDYDSDDIKRMVDFIKVVQQDNVYIGCQHGANDTDVALILNDFFNPLFENKAKTQIKPNESDFPIKLNSLYDLFTKEDKKLLGWTKEFEQRLIKKLISI